jgi:hypothetical protein
MTLSLFAGTSRYSGKSPLKLGPLRNGLSHIADDGLPAIVHMDMFDADNLLSAMTQPSKNLNLRRIRSEQTSRSRPKRRKPPLCSKTAIQLGENGHCGCVCAGHLHGERCLNFVLRPAASIIASAALMESSEIPPK